MLTVAARMNKIPTIGSAIRRAVPQEKVMKPAVLAVASLLLVLPSFAGAQSIGPVAQWSFNEGSGQVAHDSVSGTDDAIGGIFKWVNGVLGGGLRFDGELGSHRGASAGRTGWLLFWDR